MEKKEAGDCGKFITFSSPIIEKSKDDSM